MLVQQVAFSLILISSTFVQGQTRTVVDGEIGSIGDATHVEFKGKTSWNYDIKEHFSKGRKKIVLRIPPLSNVTANQLESWSGNLIKEVTVNRKGPDGNYLVEFTMKNNASKAFDYLTDDPSRLVIDFYTPKKKTRAQVAQNRAPAAVEGKKMTPMELPEKKVKTVSKKVKAVRKPAGTDYIVSPKQNDEPLVVGQLGRDFKHGIYDGADPKVERFRIRKDEIRDTAIIASRKNIFLRFPVLDLGLPYLRVLWANPPQYEVIPEETEENKLARLLITLFKEKKHAMFTKTLRFFREQYPNSKYGEIAGFLEADLFYQRWRDEDSLSEFESAMVRYRQMVERYPKSPLVERTYLLMGYSYLERDDALGALKIFQRFLSRRPKTKFKDKVELAMAEAYLRLNRYKESLKIYNRVAKSAKYPRNKIEADYLMGDASYKAGDFKSAIRNYSRAINDHPEVWQSYPNAPFNLAESYFWEGEYKKSMDTFIEFLRKFPAHPYGGYAMTRLGELLEIFGAPKERYMGAFLESYFRYRSTPGGELARVRILTERMKEMKENELKDAIEELEGIVQRATLDKTDQFVYVKESDGFFEREEFENATNVLLNYYQKNPTGTDVDVFSTRIVRNIAASIKRKVDKGDFLGALKEHARFRDSWLKRTKRLDIGYSVGTAYEQAGVYKEAGEVYRRTLNNLYSIKGTPLEKTRGTFEHLPKTDSLNLRLAAISAKENRFNDANDFLKEIRNPDQLESKEQIELVELAARVAEERGQLSTARNFLKKVSENWKGQPEMVSGPYLKLAQLQVRSRRYTKALTSLQKIINLVEDTERVDPDHHFKALELKGELLVKRKRRRQAVNTYKRLLKDFGKERDLSSLRYKTGKILFEMGEQKEAEEVWAPLAENPESVWARLASEKSQDKDWRGKYKKYLNRIPAMEGFEGRE